MQLFILGAASTIPNGPVIFIEGIWRLYSLKSMRASLRLLPLAFAVATLTAEPLDLPDQITLANGAVLRNVAILHWKNDQVVVKHSGGVDPVAFQYMAPSSHDIFVAALDKVYSCKGSVYIVTRGRGTIRLSGVEIHIAPEEGYSAIQSEIITHTNVDGQFTFNWKGAGGFVIEASASRLVGDGTEHYVWKVARQDVSDVTAIDLNNDNLQPE